MTCREVLSKITTYPSALLNSIVLGDTQTDQDADLLEHLSSCSQCTSRLESERQFRALIKHHAPKARAPEFLLDRVLDQAALEGLREPFHQRSGESGSTYAVSAVHSLMRLFTDSPFRLLAFSMATLCVGALIALFLTTPWRSEQPTVLEMVEDHIRYLPSDEKRQILSASCDEVETWFTGQLDFPIKVPEFNAVQLLGGRRCYLFDQRVALLFYAQEGRNLSLFILEDRPLDLDAISWMNYKQRKIGLADYKGYHLVFCRQRGLAYAIVSDLPSETLVDLTSQL